MESSLRVKIDGRAATDDANRLDNSLGKLKASGDRVTGSFSRFRAELFSLRGAITGLGLGLLIRQTVQLNDAWTRSEGRLRLVTNSTAELAQVQADLFKAAQDTRTEYNSTVELYARVARNAESLKRSQKELLGLTEATNQAIQIGGATTQEASAGVIQFSQALASGTLRGDELRSVLENMPRLAQAIADGLGTDIGGLRELSEAGELSAERVVAAVLSQTGKLESEFKRLPRTIGSAWTQLTNEIARGVGSADMSPIIDGLDDLRALIADPEFQKALIDVAGGMAKLIEASLKGIEKFGEAGRALGEWYAIRDGGAGAHDLVGLTKELDDVNARLKLLNELGKGGYSIFERLRLSAGESRLSQNSNSRQQGGTYQPDFESALLEERRNEIRRQLAALDRQRFEELNNPNSPSTPSDPRSPTVPRIPTSDDGQKAIDRLREQVSLFGDLTHYEELLISLREGYIKVNDPAQREELGRLAQQLDFLEAIGDESERARTAEEERKAAIQGAVETADRQLEYSGRQTRRDFRDARSYGEIGGIGGEAEAEARQQAQSQADAYAAAAQEEMLQGRFDTAAEYMEKELRAWEAFEDEKTRISRAENEARSDLLQKQAGVATGIFGDLANASAAFGEKGFKTYKAFSIAQATASMIAGAVGAFARASEAYPPPYGQIAGGIAAGAVVASGVAQIAQIEALSYGGARARGGPVEPGRAYLVGEEGPEIIVPPSAGHVMTAQQSAEMMAGNTFNVQVINQQGQIVPQRAEMDGRTLRLYVNEARRAVASDFANREGVALALESGYQTQRKGNKGGFG